jgi:SAM-dependent methyltransferase
VSDGRHQLAQRHVGIAGDDGRRVMTKVVGTYAHEAESTFRPTMLSVARARAASERVDGCEFIVADAQSRDLGMVAFDAVFSQFGIMFFSDLAAAFANLRRALRDQRHIAFACWQDVFANEWVLAPGWAVVAVTGELPPMPGPGEPEPFSLADPGRVEQLLLDAEFGSIECFRTQSRSS